VTSTDTSQSTELAVRTEATGSVEPQQPTRRGRHDWEAIRAAYTEGMPKDDADNDEDREWPTLEEVAERFDIRADQVRRRAGKESWSLQRVAVQRRIADTRTKKRASALARESVEFDTRTLSIAKMGQGAIAMRVAEILQDAHQHQQRRTEAAQRTAAGQPSDWRDYVSPVDARELDSLARAAQTFQMMGRKAMGEDVQHHDVEVNVSGEIEHVSVADTLKQDDPDRLAAFIKAAVQSGLPFGDIIEAELVEDDD
jgi:hypothetical protein